MMVTMARRRRAQEGRLGFVGRAGERRWLGFLGGAWRRVERVEGAACEVEGAAVDAGAAAQWRPGRRRQWRPVRRRGGVRGRGRGVGRGRGEGMDLGEGEGNRWGQQY